MYENNIDVFSAWTPFDVIDKGDSGSEPSGRISGVVSTETVDQQGEKVVQKGLDWDYFLSKGWFNWEHAAGPENVLGYPDKVEPVEINGTHATRVEGRLLMNKAKAKEIYNTAVSLQKSESDRRLGFSIEGQVLERDGKTIKKARILNVAITAHPIHPDARLEILAQSLLARAASVGYQIPATGGGNIAPLVTQSLEGSVSTATFGARGLEAYLKSLKEEDLIALRVLKSFPTLNFGDAHSIVTDFLRKKGVLS